jgi:hypothetical protein
VPIGLPAREWERTCAECSDTWRVPRSIGRRGIRGLFAMSVRAGAIGARSNPRGGNLARVVAARAAQMEGFQICTKCGVDDFTQRPVPRSR